MMSVKTACSGMPRLSLIPLSFFLALLACGQGPASQHAELTGPPSAARTLSAAKTAEALSRPESLDLGVWSILEHLGIGVYHSDGRPLLAGSERRQSDFWIYDFEVPILERMAQGGSISFGHFADYLRRHGSKLSAASLGSLYTEAYAKHADAFLSQLVSQLGVSFSSGASLTPLEAFLLQLDATVPPNREQKQEGSGSSAAASGDSTCSFTGSTESSGWGLAYESQSVEDRPRQGSLILQGNLLAQSISAELDKSSSGVHEGHNGPGGVEQIALKVTANFAGSTPICGFPGDPGLSSIPQGPQPLALDLVWRFSPIAYEHGAVVPVAPGSEPGGLTKDLGKPFGSHPGIGRTSSSGEAAVQYRAREEPSHGKGTFHSAPVDVSVELQNVGDSLRAAGFPDTLAEAADVPDQRAVTGFGLSWHSLGEHWTGTIESTSTNTWSGVGGSLTCTEIWNLSLSFDVAQTGSIQGQGKGMLLRTRDCHASFQWDFTNAQHVTFAVGGKRTSDHLELHVTETSIDGQTQGLLNYTLLLYPRAPALRVPITAPGVAGGLIETRNVLPGGYQAKAGHQVSLRCTNCD